MSPEIPPLLHRRQALQDGLTDDDLRRLRRDNTLIHVARGAYLAESEYRKLDALGKHRARAVAAADRLESDAVLSHISAAAIHGFDVWGAPLKAVHLTRPDCSHGRRRAMVHVHPAPLAPSEIVTISGLRVTSAARTIADLARTVSLKSAVSTGDHALHLGLSTEDLAAAVTGAAGRHGIARARRAVALMDGRSESVGESLSRLVIKELGLPTPDLQRTIQSSEHRNLGRVDFLFEEAGVVGEFDGKMKYGKYLKPGEHPGEPVYREKLREDRIRDTGLMVVRWVWGDLDRPLVLRRRIEKAFERAHR